MTAPSGCTLKLQLQHFLLRESANSHADADAVDDQTVSLETAVLVVLGRSHLSLSLSVLRQQSLVLSLSLGRQVSQRRLSVLRRREFRGLIPCLFSRSPPADESATLSLALFPSLYRLFFHPKRFEGQV